MVAAIKAHPPTEGLPKFDAAFRAKFDDEHPLGWVEHRAAWSADGVYGRWVLSHSAVIRIDDTLYLHAGIGPEFLPFDMDALNKAVVAALRQKPDVAGGPADILENEQGPLWYRGMALNDEVAEAPQVAAALAHFGVRRIVVGHTKRFSMVNARFDGAVIFTDIAVPNGCVDPHAFLIKEGDTLTTVYRGHRLAMGVSGEAHTGYLSAIAALDQISTPGGAFQARCSVN